MNKTLEKQALKVHREVSEDHKICLTTLSNRHERVEEISISQNATEINTCSPAVEHPFRKLERSAVLLTRLSSGQLLMLSFV